MELTIEQSCPSCGAAITLREDDRVVQCNFCDVKNYMVHRSLPRFALPARLPKHIDEDQLLYVPYLRFKGSIYCCQSKGVQHHIIDTTRVGVKVKSLPVSLGLRPQAMKVLPVTSHLQGTFIRQSIKAESVFDHAVKLTTLFKDDKGDPITHRAFIGETLSRVYLPLYIHNALLYDGITHQQIGAGRAAESIGQHTIQFQTSWEPTFLSTLCPGCGETMGGKVDTLVLHCDNCETLWRESGGRFVRLDWGRVFSADAESIYVPFWQIEPQITGLQLDSFADLLRLTNQPVVVRQQHKERKLTFFVPAFKMNPSLFLQAAKNMTLSQLNIPDGEPGKLVHRYPVTLPQKEAVQALKTILAATAISKRKVLPRLPELTIQAQNQKLVYLPFTDVGHDLLQEHSRVSIMSAALRFGRSL